MVRVTRYLLIGNLPSNLNEEKILGHFQQYGKVQSVKLTRENSNNDCSATIAFNDIKSASKAHSAENIIEECKLETNYFEPPHANSTSSAIYIHHSEPTNNNQNVQNQPSTPIRSSVVSSRHLLTNSNR